MRYCPEAIRAALRTVTDANGWWECEEHGDDVGDCAHIPGEEIPDADEFVDHVMEMEARLAGLEK